MAVTRNSYGVKWLFWMGVVLLTILPHPIQCQVEDLCNVSGCSCNTLSDDLIEVNCQCSTGQEIILGPEDGTPSNSQIGFAPQNTISLSITGCQQLEVLSKTLNAVPMLQNITVKDVQKVILQSRLYEAGRGNGQSATINNFEIENVQDLQVMRHTFEGVRVTGTFMLKSVIVKKTPSMAFSFDYIKDFSIMGGRFDRVSMWGFKLENCDEFNALGQSRFFSLASQAFHMKCKRFMLVQNTFDNLMDSSLGVRYGVADIQGNTFEKLTGKPFVDMRPMIETNPGEFNTSGLIFSGNKFACKPTLPFNAFAMPSYDSIKNAPEALVRIENNHFTCECDKMSWFLGAMTKNFDTDVIANGRGSLDFLRKLYDTAGKCLSCGLLRCEETQTKFHDFAKSALMVHKGQLTCSKSGQPLKSQKPGRENTAFSVSGEEESLSDTRNMEHLNTATALFSSKSQLFTTLMALLISVKIFA